MYSPPSGKPKAVRNVRRREPGEAGRSGKGAVDTVPQNGDAVLFCKCRAFAGLACNGFPHAGCRRNRGRKRPLSSVLLLQHPAEGFFQFRVHGGGRVKAHFDELVHFRVDLFYLGNRLV